MVIPYLFRFIGNLSQLLEDWNKTTCEAQFYLTSLNSDAQLISQAIRKHWGIENEAHCTLDCTFAKDPCRIRSFLSIVRAILFF